jgi:hypothetical protein
VRSLCEPTELRDFRRNATNRIIDLTIRQRRLILDENEMATSSATNLNIDELTDTELTPKGKFAVWSAVLSIMFFSQIAYNVGDFPVTTDFICYALLVGSLVTSGYASISSFSSVLLLMAAVITCSRTALASSTTSWTSLLLLFALYVPFSVRLESRNDLQVVQKYILNAYISAATAIGVIAIVQLILVNVFGMSALTNVYFILPEGIRGAGAYTFFREGGGVVKANGFFLRESADLSIIVGFALIIEYCTRARLGILGILTAALLSSFSGSGILALAAGLLMPRSLTRIPLFLVYTLGVVLALYVLDNLDIPGLELWFGRLSEFQTPNTSAYSRFVAPMVMVQHSFSDGLAATWLGNGAGSFLRDVTEFKLAYEVNDPTWAKLIYEYGMVGFVLLSSVFMIRLYSAGLRIEICNAFLFSWLSVGLVLKPSFTFIVWLLTLVPKERRQPAPRNSQ